MLLISFITLQDLDGELMQDEEKASFGVLLGDGFVCDLSNACELIISGFFLGCEYNGASTSAFDLATDHCDIIFAARQ